MKASHFYALLRRELFSCYLKVHLLFLIGVGSCSSQTNLVVNIEYIFGNLYYLIILLFPIIFKYYLFKILKLKKLMIFLHLHESLSHLFYQNKSQKRERKGKEGKGKEVDLVIIFWLCC